MRYFLSDMVYVSRLLNTVRTVMYGCLPYDVFWVHRRGVGCRLPGLLLRDQQVR
jgi:hypothetical protein